MQMATEDTRRRSAAAHKSALLQIAAGGYGYSAGRARMRATAGKQDSVDARSGHEKAKSG